MTLNKPLYLSELLPILTLRWGVGVTGVVTLTGDSSRYPLLHQELPVKQASSQAGVPAKNLVTAGFLAVAR